MQEIEIWPKLHACDTRFDGLVSTRCWCRVIVSTADHGHSLWYHDLQGTYPECMDGEEGRRRPSSPKAGKSVTREIGKSESRQEHLGEGTSRVLSSYSTTEEQAANFVTLASTKLRHGT